MDKLKVGDRFKVIKADKIDRDCDVKVGSTGEVVSYTDYAWVVRMDDYSQHRSDYFGAVTSGHAWLLNESSMEKIDEDTVEFVSYSGKFPNLCSGVLVLKINGKEVIMDNSMTSGGNVGFDDDWSLILSHGEWSVEVPKEFEHLEEIISEIVNDNVPYGCCGGCS